MNIKHIRVFINVYNEKSITRAAEKLKLTQPATSLAIKELEEYYNMKFFERSGRGIRATEAAEHFYPEAARIISLFDEMDDNMKNWNVAGRLRIGASISIGSCILPSFIKEFRRMYKDLDVYVSIDSSDEIQNRVLENKLDFALIEGNIHSNKIKSQKFMEDELVPICSRFHKFAGKEDVDLQEVKNEIFLTREKNSGTRQQVESFFSTNGVMLEPKWDSTSTAAIINAVSEDIGISVLPKRMLDYHIKQHKIYTFSIKGIKMTRDYNIIYHENKFITQPMKDFFEMVQKGK
ncbi:MAG: LysR family transcriptional regulator [Lachnospiraceae bacterium]|nr:LysR family transcriptional regulator [Lachnospiraceae bacterium]